jgi:hypothetical protein
MEQCHASFWIIHFQQGAETSAVSLLEQSCVGLDLTPEAGVDWPEKGNAFIES